MSNNHLNISYSLEVAVCVWLKYEHIFLMCSSPPLNVTSLKSVCLQYNKRVCLLFGSWFRTPTQKNCGKSFHKTSFQLGMGLKKVQKQGKDERMQDDYPTSAVYFCRCRVVLLF